MRKKNTIRLNESMLNRIIKESVKRVLRESATKQEIFTLDAIDITLEEGRRTIIDIYNGRSATGGNNSGGGSTPIDSPDTTAAVSDATESTSPVSESISDTQNVSESGAGETDVTEPETEVTEPATDTDVTEPALDPNPDGGDKNQNQNQN